MVAALVFYLPSPHLFICFLSGVRELTAILMKTKLAFNLMLSIKVNVFLLETSYGCMFNVLKVP